MWKITFFASLVLAWSVPGGPLPSAKEILDSVRMLEARQQLDLEGQLRQNDAIIPFRLRQTGPMIRYSFADPTEVLQLRLGESGARLELVTRSHPAPAAGPPFGPRKAGEHTAELPSPTYLLYPLLLCKKKHTH